MDTMKKNATISIAAVALLTALALAVGLAAQQGQEAKPSRYTITDLGTFGGTLSEADGINNSGSLAGNSFLPGNAIRHAYKSCDGEYGQSFHGRSNRLYGT